MSKKKDVLIAFRLEAETHKGLKKAADKKDVPISWLVRQYVRQGLLTESLGQKEKDNGAV